MASRLWLVGIFGLIAFACGDEQPESSDAGGPTYSIALKVEGQGTVTSKPAGFACQGPKDCGQKNFSAEVLELDSLPASGWVLIRMRIDSKDLPVAQRLLVEGGKSHSIAMTFGPPGSQPVAVGDGGTVVVTSDGGTIGSDAGPPSPPCGAAVCDTGQQCCMFGKGSYTLSCAKACGGGSAAGCTTAGGCANGQVCCLRANGPGGKGELACEAAASCTGDGAPLCDAQHACDAAAGTCTSSGDISVCTPQK